MTANQTHSVELTFAGRTICLESSISIVELAQLFLDWAQIYFCSRKIMRQDGQWFLVKDEAYIKKHIDSLLSELIQIVTVKLEEVLSQQGRILTTEPKPGYSGCTNIRVKLQVPENYVSEEGEHDGLPQAENLPIEVCQDINNLLASAKGKSRKTKYDDETKRKAMAMLDAGSKPIEISEELSVHIKTVYHWSNNLKKGKRDLPVQVSDDESSAGKNEAAQSQTLDDPVASEDSNIAVEQSNTQIGGELAASEDEISQPQTPDEFSFISTDSDGSDIDSEPNNDSNPLESRPASIAYMDLAIAP